MSIINIIHMLLNKKKYRRILTPIRSRNLIYIFFLIGFKNKKVVVLSENEETKLEVHPSFCSLSRQFLKSRKKY